MLWIVMHAALAVHAGYDIAINVAAGDIDALATEVSGSA
jgi:hypothetical protein